MAGFLDALGEKLADQWVALLVVPGTLYCAAAVIAATLGQAHALDGELLPRRVTAWTRTPVAMTSSGAIVLASAMLAAAAAAGLAARALGRVIELLALDADWPAPVRALARWGVGRRGTRWAKADDVYQARRLEAAQTRAEGGNADPAKRQSAFLKRTRISELAPARPTWSGDRIHSVETRLSTELSFELGREWPVVWLKRIRRGPGRRRHRPGCDHPVVCWAAGPSSMRCWLSGGCLHWRSRSPRQWQRGRACVRRRTRMPYWSKRLLGCTSDRRRHRRRQRAETCGCDTWPQASAGDDAKSCPGAPERRFTRALRWD